MKNYLTLNSKFAILLFTTALVFLPLSNAMAIDSLTTPTGEVVAAGAATFDRPAAGQLNINQSSQRTIIDWNNFDIGKSATTEFFQPNSTALAVNRVVGIGSDPTHILGTLKANGQLMVLDRNGVIFGKNSTVNVGSIVASTGNVLNSDITNGGTFEILNATTGTIENRGNITAADAGLVALVAPTVKNSGVINARLGKVSLASGSRATVDLYGDNLITLAVDSDLGHALIHNRGDILAENGDVTLTTRVARDIVDNSINMDGIIDVSSISLSGGTIVLSGAADTTVKGNMKANSEAGGGDITIDSSDITINRNANLETNTTFTGIGGRITLNAANSIDSAGKIKANGEEAGGRVIISAGDNVNVSGNVEARATGASDGGLIRISSGGDETRIASRLNVTGIDAGGTIDLNAKNIMTLTERSRLYAKTLSTGAGGRVIVNANDVASNGHIDVSGQEGGGQIRMTGDNSLNINGNMTGYSGIIGTGARVALGSSGDINMNGRIQVNGTSGGGRITMTGNNISISEDARLYARGLESELPEVISNPGGSVIIDAEQQATHAGIINVNGYHDGNGFVSMSGNDVNVTGDIRADAEENGDGGTVLLQGENHTQFGGRISARGGSTSGNGGFVKFNQPNTVEADSSVNVSAPNGNSGTFIH